MPSWNPPLPPVNSNNQHHFNSVVVMTVYFITPCNHCTYVHIEPLNHSRDSTGLFYLISFSFSFLPFLFSFLLVFTFLFAFLSFFTLATLKWITLLNLLKQDSYNNAAASYIQASSVLGFYDYNMIVAWERTPTNSVVSAHLFVSFTFFLQDDRHWLYMTKAVHHTCTVLTGSSLFLKMAREPPSSAAG